MVVHGDVQETPGVDQLARDGAVVRARRGVPAGVVVRHDDARRAESDGEPEDFPGMHQGGIEDPPRHFLDGVARPLLKRRTSQASDLTKDGV